jgi:hypothetical protein
MNSKQLVNKGSHLDNDESFQPKDTFRHAMNGMLISYNDGNYSWQNSIGNKVSFNVGLNIIGWCNLREDLIIFSTDEVIGAIDKVVFNGLGEATVYPQYALDDFGFSQLHPIVNECEGYYESQKIQRVYWTDFKNQFRSLNLSQIKYLHTNEPNIITVSFVPNKQYVVVSGSVVVPSGTYTKGQSFSSPTTPIIYDLTNTVIAEYLSANSMNSSPVVTWGDIGLNQILQNQGTVGYGQYFFCYQYYSLDGRVTNWSPLSNGIAMINIGNTYQGQQGGQQLGSGITGTDIGNGNSNNAFELKITNVETIYDHIRFGVFTSSEYNTINPDGFSFSEVATSPDHNKEQLVIYFGDKTHIKKISLDDVLIGKAAIEKVKTFCITQRYLIVANTVESGEFNNTNVTATITISPEVYEIVSDARGNVYSPNGDLTGHDKMAGVSSDIYVNQWYKVKSLTISYNSISYSIGDLFKGIVGITHYVGSGSVVPVIRKKKYKKFDNSYVYDVIEIPNDYLDYKSPIVSENAVGYWGGETYRFGLLPYDKQGRAMHVRFGADIKFPERNIQGNTYQLNGNSMPCTASSMVNDALGNGTYSQSNLNIMSALIDGIDITDIIDQISAISIVRCSRDGQESTLYEGLLQPLVRVTEEFPAPTNEGHVLYPAETHFSDGFERFSHSSYFERRPYCYALYSPERMFYFNSDIPSIGDSLKINGFFEQINPLNNGLGQNTAFSNFNQKFYKECNPIDNTLSIGKVNEVNIEAGFQEVDSAKNILSGSNHSANMQVPLLDVGNLNNDTIYSYTTELLWSRASILPGGDAGYFKRSTITRASILETNYGEGSLSATFPNGFVDQQGDYRDKTTVTYVQYKRRNANLYGGTTDEAKALNLYYTIGHYLPITTELKNDIINSNGRYVLNGLQVFGGDCFINLFDFNLATYDSNWEKITSPIIGGNTYYDSWQLEVVFPVQSSVNTAFRQGFHTAKDRMWGKGISGNSTGLRVNVSPPHIENYNKTINQSSINEAYLTCYSTDKKKITLKSLPTNFEFETEFDYRIRWSQLKSNGEDVDKFMIFDSLQFLDVEPNHGMINNVRTEANRLFYWQEHAVGSVPVNERMVVTSAVGEMVNLGVNSGVGLGNGRFDERHSFYGNQHQHSLIKTTNGFCWYDLSNSAFVHMNTKLGINNDSIIKGYYQFFRNEIDPLLYENFNPVISRGIVAGYDEVYRTVYMTFFAIDKSKFSNHTIAFNDVTNTFVGEHSFFPTLYAKLHGRFITTEGVATNIGLGWIHDTADSGRGNYFGVIKDSTIELIVNSNFDMSKIFDTFMVEGNDKFFYKIECWTNNQYGVDEDIIDKTTLELLSDNVEYRNQTWVGNLPLTGESDRFTDNWLKIKFYFDNSQNKLIKLLSLQTNYRQAR